MTAWVVTVLFTPMNPPATITATISTGGVIVQIAIPSRACSHGAPNTAISTPRRRCCMTPRLHPTVVSATQRVADPLLEWQGSRAYSTRESPPADPGRSARACSMAAATRSTALRIGSRAEWS
jgi:hypothetical protein